jgi:hypothetical protein
MSAHGPGVGRGPRMTKSNDPLRLQTYHQGEAERVAKAEGTTLNQFINVAVAEKLRTGAYFKERAARADVRKALEVLERAGNEPPWEGDEIAG